MIKCQGGMLESLVVCELSVEASLARPIRLNVKVSWLSWLPAEDYFQSALGMHGQFIYRLRHVL